MGHMMQHVIAQVLGSQSGATAIEYGLIASLVSVAAVGAFTALGESLSPFFIAVAVEITNATNAAAP